MNEVFNEQTLRNVLIDKFGAFGWHVEVYDMILKKSVALDLLLAGGYIDPEKLEQAKSIVAGFSETPSTIKITQP